MSYTCIFVIRINMRKRHIDNYTKTSAPRTSKKGQVLYKTIEDSGFAHGKQCTERYDMHACSKFFYDIYMYLYVVVFIYKTDKVHYLHKIFRFIMTIMYQSH